MPCEITNTRIINNIEKIFYFCCFIENNKDIIKRSIDRALILNRSYEINICEFCINTDKYLCKYCICVDCSKKFYCIDQKMCKIKIKIYRR